MPAFFGGDERTRSGSEPKNADFKTLLNPGPWALGRSGQAGPSGGPIPMLATFEIISDRVEAIFGSSGKLVSEQGVMIV